MKLVLVAVVLLLAAPVQAQLSGDWIEKNLATGCAPMGLNVDVGGAEDDERLHSSLLNLAESRLRSAHLYDEDGWDLHHQDVNLVVTVVGTATHIRLVLYRFMWDVGFGKPGVVIVWMRGIVGSHGSDSGRRSNAADLVDQFITEYLRANPECG